MTTVVVQQPSYIPWLGYFEQICQADVFVFYDDVQYTKNDWRNRNKIKTPREWQWLTVPVNYEFGQRICDVKTANQQWQRKHLKAIEANYARAPYFKDYIEYFKDMYSREWTYLYSLSEFSVMMLGRILKIPTRFLFSRELCVEGGQTERLVNICKHLGADRYYSPWRSRIYLDEKHFENAGIKVEFQDYKHPLYPQLWGEFMPYLSVIDLLFNCGEESLDVIKGKY